MDRFSWDDNQQEQTFTRNAGGEGLYEQAFGAGGNGLSSFHQQATGAGGAAAGGQTGAAGNGLGSGAAAGTGGTAALANPPDFSFGVTGAGTPTARPGATPGTGTPPPAANPNAGGELGKFREANAYKGTLEQIKQTTDPQRRAVLQDQLARTLFSTMKTQGHDVKWEGDQLIIDGRPYMIAGAASGAGGLEAGAQDGGTVGGLSPSGNTGIANIEEVASARLERSNGGGQWNTDGYAKPGYTATAAGNVLPGFDAQKWADPNHQTPKYVVGRILSEAGDLRDPAARAQSIERIQQAYPGTTFNGKDKVNIPGVGVVDIFVGAGAGIYGAAFQPEDGAAGSQQDLARTAAGAHGVNVNSDAAAADGVTNEGLTAQHDSTGRQKTQSEIEAERATAQVLASQPQNQRFRTQGSTYQPGEIKLDDIPEFGYEELLKQIGAYEFGGFGELPGLELGAADPEVEALVRKILAKPESLDEQTVAQMKAREKDEIAEMAGLDAQNRRGDAIAMGIDDSRWFAANEAEAGRARDSALLKSNRDLDIKAAETRAGDRRAAAELGNTFLNSKSARQLATRNQLFSERNAGEQLKLASTESKRASAALAADTSLRAAALRGDRMALREQVNQRAAELGQSADELQMRYTLALIDDATRRYGIDIGARLDREKLAQAGREFQEELAFRFAQLGQNERQFGASYGLEFLRTQNELNKSERSAYDEAFG